MTRAFCARPAWACPRRSGRTAAAGLQVVQDLLAVADRVRTWPGRSRRRRDRRRRSVSRPSILAAARRPGSIPFSLSDLRGVIAELVQPPAALGDPDHRHIEHPALDQPDQRGERLQLGQVPGRAEDHQRIYVSRHCLPPRKHTHNAHLRCLTSKPSHSGAAPPARVKRPGSPARAEARSDGGRDYDRSTGASWRYGGVVGMGPDLTGLSVTDRETRGREARAAAPRSAQGQWQALPDRPGPGRAAGRAGQGPGARSGPGALRPDAPAPVHLLPGRGAHHGLRPGHRAAIRASPSSCAATRTCPTSASSARRSARCSPTSTTSTRPCPAPGSGT